MTSVPCKIYGLVSTAEPDKVRYVGQTVRPLKVRLRGHRRSMQTTRQGYYPVYHWMRKTFEAGHDIQIKFLTDGIWNQTEQEYIKLFKDNRLLNCTEGGAGTVGHHFNMPEDFKLRQKTSLKGNKNAAGSKRSKEHMQKIIAANTGLKRSEETKLKMSKPKSPEHRQKIKDAVHRRWAKLKGLK